MSWESSLVYYRLINEQVRDELGGLHSADLLLRSVDFAEIEALQRAGAWQEAGDRLAAEAQALIDAGAEVLVLCTNTMHKVADAITGAVSVPFVHIADATATAVRASGVGRVGLIATAYTMEQDFYVGRLRDRHGLEVLVPGAEDRRFVHRVIFEELVLGDVRDSSRDEFDRVMGELVDRGAQAMILGCTEIGLLVDATEVAVPVFDSTVLHARAAVAQSLRAAATPGRA